jgi:hypothetical protein
MDGTEGDKWQSREIAVALPSECEKLLGEFQFFTHDKISLLHTVRPITGSPHDLHNIGR